MNPTPPSVNPFPGLRPFRSDEKHLFFGREDQTGELLRRLGKNRFLAVVGPSGSGKSSLVRAGLLPELFGGTITSAGSHWEVLVMRPGGDPLTNLAAAMVEADLYDPEIPGIVDQVRTTLDRSARGLVEAVRQSDVDEKTNTLVVVDQFEEIFRFREQGGQSLEEASAFVKLLIEAAAQASPSIYVVLTMRSDYLGECAQFRGLAEMVNQGEYLIPRLNRANRRSAIEGPIHVGGAEISKRLLTKLLNDVGDDPDQLPLLQHALMRTWDCWSADHAEGEPVDLRHYDATGGMQEALSRHADELYDTFKAKGKQALVEHIFRALTERVDETRGIRRPLRLGQLAEVVDGDLEDVKEVVDTFRAQSCTFLMPPHPAELKERTVIDISHESLMRVWRRLRGWVDEEAQSAGIFRRLSETAQLHAQGRAGLYHDPDLQIALSWREEDQPNAAWAQLYRGDFTEAMAFLDQSAEARQREERLREEARQKELAQAKALADSQARAARLLRRFATTVCVALVVALGLAAWAVKQSRIADRAATKARTEQGKTWLANARSLEDGGDHFGARMKAARAIGFQGLGREQQPTSFGEDYEVLLQPDMPEWGESISLVAKAATYFPLWQSGSLPASGDELNDLCVSPAGSLVVTAEEGAPEINLWDDQTGQHLLTVPLPEECEALAFDRTGSLLAGGGNLGLYVWKVTPDRQLNLWRQGDLTDDTARAMEFSPDGSRLIFGDSRGQIFQWNLETDEISDPILPLANPRIEDLEFSPDGRILVATARDKELVWLDGQSLQPIDRSDPVEYHNRNEFSRMTDRISSVSFSPDGRWMVSGGVAVPVTLWDVTRREPVTTLLRAKWRLLTRTTSGANPRSGGGTFGCLGVDYSPDGTRLAVVWSEVGSRSARPGFPTISLFDTSDPEATRPKLIKHLHGHAEPITRVKFTADSKRLVTTDLDFRTFLWDTSRDHPIGTTTPGHTGQVDALAVSRDGRYFASGDQTGLTRIWETYTGRVVAVLPRAIQEVTDLCFSPDGRHLYTLVWGERVLRRWAVETGRLVDEVPLQLWPTALQLSPDGRSLAVCGSQQRIDLFDPQTMTLQRYVNLRHEPRYLQLFPDSRRVVIYDNNDRSIAVYDLGTEGNEAVLLDEKGPGLHETFVQEISLNATGTRLVTCSNDGRISRWSISEDGTLTLLPSFDASQHRGIIRAARYEPEGNRLLTTDNSGTVFVWGNGEGELLAKLTHPRVVNRVAFSPDGEIIVTGGNSGILQIWSAGLASQGQRFGTFTIENSNLMGVNSIAFDPQTDQLLVAGNWLGVTKRVGAWDIDKRSATPARELAQISDGPVGVEISPNGRYLAISTTQDEAPQLHVRDLKTGTNTVLTADDIFRRACFSPDSKTLLTGHVGGELVVWDMDTLQPAGEPHQMTSFIILGIDFMPDGKSFFLTGAKNISHYSFDPASRAISLIKRFGMDSSWLLDLDVSSDGRFLVVAGSGVASIWDTKTYRQVGPDLKHEGWVSKGRFSPDGSLLVTAMGNDRFRLWDVKEARLISDLSMTTGQGGGFQPGSIAFSPDGTTLVLRNQDSIVLHELSRLVNKNDLSVYATAIDLDNAAEGVRWINRSHSLAAPRLTQSFVTPGHPFHHALSPDQSVEDQIAPLYTDYRKKGYLLAAAGVLSAMKDPPENAWSELIQDLLMTHDKADASGNQAQARRYMRVAEELAVAHGANPETQFLLDMRKGTWEASAQHLMRLMTAGNPATQQDLIDAFFATLNLDLAEAVANGALPADKARAPERNYALAHALKGTIDDVLLSWDNDLKAGLQFLRDLDQRPEIILINQAAQAEGQTLAAKGSVWKYLAEDRPAATNWKDPDFDDTVWLSGPGDIGFGGNSDQLVLKTIITRHEERTTYYFRHAFERSSVPPTNSLYALSLQRDDGAVIYLNGTEIHRELMPGGTIDDTTKAVGGPVSGNDETSYFDSVLRTPVTAALRPGRNVLAVEMHQAGRNSSDLHLDLSLTSMPDAPTGHEPIRQAFGFLRALSETGGDRHWQRVLRTGSGSDAENTVDARTWYALSVVAHLEGDVDREIHCLERAVEGTKDTTTTLGYLRHIELRQILLAALERRGDTEGAKALLADILKVPTRMPDRSANELDLSAFYNSSLFDGRGWHNMYWSRHDLDLTSVSRTIAPVEGATFDARGIIQLNSGVFSAGDSATVAARTDHTGKTVGEVLGRDLPERVDGIPVGRTGKRIHLLGNSLLSNAGTDDEIAQIILHYADDTSATLSIRFGTHFNKVFGGNGLTTSSRVWAKPDPAIRLHQITLDNPEPDKLIARMDFVSTLAEASPFVVAITVE